MAQTTRTPKRLTDSYETACQLLRAQPLEPSHGPLPDRGRFDHNTASLEQIRRVASHSLPPPIRVKAYPLQPIPTRPHAVAEFVAELLLQRDGRRLKLAEPRVRPPFSERANLRWIVWGDLIASPVGHLALGPLAVGPYPGADSTLEPGTSPYRGVTGEVLRAIPVELLIREIVAQLKGHAEWQQHLAEKYGWQTPEQQRQLLEETIKRISTPPQRQGRKYPDSHYQDIARLYIDLLDQGYGRTILTQLATQLDVSPQTARNWVHRARQLGYLTAGQQGRAGATAGPRLHEPANDQQP